MELGNRAYMLWDFIRIPFRVSPGAASLRAADKLVYALIPSLQVLATAAFIDAALEIAGGRAEPLRILMPLVGLLLLISHQYITFALMGLARTRMNVRLNEAFRTAIVEKRAKLRYQHVEDSETWDLIGRVGDDPAGKLGGGFDIVLRMADMAVRVGSILLVLAAQVWWAALVIVAFSIPLFILAVRSGRANYEASKEAAKHARRASYLQGVLTDRDHAEERTLFAYSGELNQRFYEKAMSAYRINFRAQRTRFIRMKSASLITVLISVMIAGVLVAPLGSGEISVGMFMAFVTAAFGLAQMMSWELTYITSELATHREYLRDLSAFAALSDTPGATDPPAPVPDAPQCIEFRGVSFAYPGTRKKVLDGLNLRLYARKHYAFVGENGAGKTTLTKLLTGLYDEYAGEILVDGRNLRDFSQAELKALFSIVYQDFARYQVRAADSVGLGNARGADEAEIAAALHAMGMDEALNKLPAGLDTPLGRIREGGADLSGGEWQRVAIARALVSRAPVRILDEPTAALDPVAESEVYALFDAISRDQSTIFITHRLGAARLADEIFVLAGGHVAEQGTHAELMAQGGIYTSMYEAQRGWYA